MRGARQNGAPGISIHAPREGGDGYDPTAADILLVFQSTPPARGATGSPGGGGCFGYISIHAPREGGDTLLIYRVNSGGTFQSTPPARGATRSGHTCQRTSNNFNPRPPRGGRRYDAYSTNSVYLFQSTPPARGATVVLALVDAELLISIHAPREGGDGVL